MADIFISYKKERREHAQRLAAVLEAYGYEVWWDYSLAVGPDFRDQIEAKLEVSKLVIVLWCSGAVKSKFVRSEATRADKREKLIQCYLEWVEPPLGFEEAQGQPLVNWTGQPEGETLAGLIDAVTARLGERRRADNMIRIMSDLAPLPEVEPMQTVEPEEAVLEEDTKPQATPEATRAYLIGLAGLGRTATYAEASGALGCPEKALWGLLNLTAEENQSRGEPLLCALIVNEDGLPGRGFFKRYAPGLPEGGSDQATAHAKMVRDVLAHDWAQAGNVRPQQITPEAPSTKRWALIEKSLDPRDYDDFLKVFPTAPEAFEALRHKRQLDDWSEVDQDASKAVSAFLKDPTKGASLFPALDDHARKTMRRAAEAELKAKQEREAAERAKAEAEARELREWEERLVLEAGSAALAAKAGKLLAERVFPVRLDGVRDWPEPNMVAIPPGRFLMGSPSNEERWSAYDGREEPQHEVRIDYSFALGQHGVTFAEWDAAVAAGAMLEKPGDEDWGRDKRPVINVSWVDAQAYLAWLNERVGLDGRVDAYRLPSEAEWEHACRAGTDTPFSFGTNITKVQAQFSEGELGSAGSTVPVGSFSANDYGLHDMHGNVYEWCADNWHRTYSGAPVDGSVWYGGEASRRVLRGGSWYNTPQYLRSAIRSRDYPTSRYYDRGFRVARTLSPPSA